MNTSVPSAEQSLRFLQDVQLLLEEGSFTSTYKFALMHALVDLAVENGDVGGAALTVHSNEIAEKLIGYYWRQVVPYPSPGGGGDVLMQNTDRQAAIINEVQRMYADSNASLAQARANGTRWQDLVRSVAGTVRKMPLWKLQTVRDGEREFLYPNVGRGASVELHPGVAYCLREFHGLVQAMVQGAWVRWVRGVRQNASSLGQVADLQEFMFGSERASLQAYVPLLRELQNGKCFYCEGGLGSRCDVDHFIPWARYSLDLGHNFVLAHQGCNNDKRDLLGGVNHLETWIGRNRDHHTQMNTYFADCGLPSDVQTTESVALWAYEQTERNGGSVWVGKGTPPVRLEAGWRGCF